MSLAKNGFRLDFDLGRYNMKKLNKYSIFETFMMTMITLLIGYFIDSKDPAFVHSKLNVALLIVSFITLFHGLFSGMVSAITISMVLFFYYDIFSYKVFFEITVFALLLGEFHSFWHRKIGKKAAEAGYLREKLDQLSTAFYGIKISHDQLEKHYILQPVTIRSSISDIKKISIINQQKAIETFMIYLAKIFTIKEYGIYDFVNEKLKPIFQTEDNLIDMEDLLLKVAIDKRTSIFVSDTSEKIQRNTNLLAVIPIKEGLKIQRFFIIKNMPFMLFNKDILIKISILLFYFFNLMEKEIVIKNLPINLDFLQNISKYEFHKLYKLYQKFQLNSSIIIFRISDEYIYKRVSKLIEKSNRKLDIFSLKRYNNTFIITVILPFTEVSSAHGFTSRIIHLIEKENILEHFEKNTVYDYFTLSDIKQMHKFVGVNYD